MWAVTQSGNILRTYTTEDEAWEYVMRMELNYIPDADSLSVREISEYHTEDLDDSADSA